MQIHDTFLAHINFFFLDDLTASASPRTNTSRRAIFQRDYAAAFEGADRVLVREVDATPIYSATGEVTERLSAERLVSVSEHLDPPFNVHLLGSESIGSSVPAPATLPAFFTCSRKHIHPKIHPKVHWQVGVSNVCFLCCGLCNCHSSECTC